MPRLRLVPIFIAGLLVAVACNTAADSSLAAQVYFTRVAALTDTFDAANRQPSPSAGARESSLRDLAAGLDDLRPPSDEKTAHHDLTVATKNLADSEHRLATSATVSPNTATGFANDWERACHLLQDTALAKNIDVDLRCATALHTAASGG